ncbi:MAG: hypothetical protein JWP63_1416 [Candidatus Solibacter sp.]|nr:hypothetical protein [Candidatus Solibacter sp.]
MAPFGPQQEMKLTIASWPVILRGAVDLFG